MIVLNKDSLMEIHHTNTIRYVMKNGELFEDDTLKSDLAAAKPLREFLVGQKQSHSASTGRAWRALSAFDAGTRVGAICRHLCK